jgi:hypothetical protein
MLARGISKIYNTKQTHRNHSNASSITFYQEILDYLRMHFLNTVLACVLATSLTTNALPQQAAGEANTAMEAVGEGVGAFHEWSYSHRLTSIKGCWTTSGIR